MPRKVAQKLPKSVQKVAKGEEKSREERIKKELSRLNKIFADADDNKKKTAKSLIENAAFHSVLLEDLKEEINRTGTQVKYKHSETQEGVTEAPAMKSLNTISKNHLAIMKQLLELVPPAPKQKKGVTAMREM